MPNKANEGKSFSLITRKILMKIWRFFLVKEYIVYEFDLT